MSVTFGVGDYTPRKIKGDRDRFFSTIDDTTQQETGGKKKFHR
ncbi:hypothetical protein [Nostoc sp. NMS8]|nr:hypothetical protein [Nostoc sp. NMS8]